MVKKSPQKSAASAKAKADPKAKAEAKSSAKAGVAIALSTDAEQLLHKLAAEAGCSIDELAADLLVKQIEKRARQKEKIESAGLAPLEAFLEMPVRQGGVADELFEADPTPAEHLSFKKISERQRKQSTKKLGTLFDDL